MIKGLIFDVHRTLVDDSGFPRDRIWRLIAQEGIDIDMDIYYQQYCEISSVLFNWLKIDPFISIREIHRKRLEFYYQLYCVKRDLDADLNYLWKEMGRSKIYPDASSVLNQLKESYKIGLLSNADDDDPLIKILLDAGFSFDVIVTSQSCQVYKPFRKIFDYTICKLNLDKHEVLMIGDSLISDILGARNAGIKNVWLNRDSKMIEDGLPTPDFQISNLEELLPLLERRIS